MTKAKIINCHQLSVRRNVIDPDEYEDVIATLPAGKMVLVDTTKTYWSWTDKEYYKVDYGMNSEEGYGLIDCLEVIS